MDNPTYIATKDAIKRLCDDRYRQANLALDHVRMVGPTDDAVRAYCDCLAKYNEAKVMAKSFTSHLQYHKERRPT